MCRVPLLIHSSLDKPFDVQKDRLTNSSATTASEVNTQLDTIKNFLTRFASL